MQHNTVFDIVPCPNRCIKGQVKYYPNESRALFYMRNCQYCKGKGEVTAEEAKEIEEIL